MFWGCWDRSGKKKTVRRKKRGSVHRESGRGPDDEKDRTRGECSKRILEMEQNRRPLETIVEIEKSK